MNRVMRSARAWLVAGVAVAGMSVYVVAQEEAAPSQPAAESAPAAEPQSQSSEDVMRDLGGQIEPNPIIEPTQRGRGVEPAPDARAARDSAVLGAAPGMPVPKLRNEGEFIVNRKGRLVRAPNGTQMLFVFEVDSKEAAEAPMPLLPCRMLQNMEELVQERGDTIVFVVSGQVTVYRGTNYMMPTMMKLDFDRGNLGK